MNPSSSIGPLTGFGKNVWKAERIIAERHRNVRGRKTLEFLVKWDGFDTKESTWEPRQNLLSKALLTQWRLHSPALGKRGKHKKRKIVSSTRKMPLKLDFQKYVSPKKTAAEPPSQSISVPVGQDVPSQLEPIKEIKEEEDIKDIKDIKDNKDNKDIKDEEEVIYLGTSFSMSPSKSAKNCQIPIITIEDDDDVTV